jgi:1-acyl-sn-glycerol-3-phosphate acyltransferase
MSIPYWIGFTFWRLVSTLCFRRKIIGREKLAVEGGYLVVANHTSFLDPPVIGAAFPEPIHFLARKTLFKRGLGEWILTSVNSIPVNQDRPEYSSMKKIIRLVQEGEKVLIFPEGERTLDGKLKERGEPGVGLLIAKSRVPILPVRLFGAYEALPRGASFPKLKKLTLVVGDPVDLNDFIDNSGLEKKELYQGLSDRAMEAIGALELPGEE